MIVIEGTEHPFKFGTNAMSRFCRMHNVDLARAQEIAGNIINEEIGILRDLMYCGIWAGYKSERKDCPFDEYQVGDWIDSDPNVVVKFFSLITEQSAKEQGTEDGQLGKES